MLIGLIVMAAIGIAGLVIANYYSKTQPTAENTKGSGQPSEVNFG